MNVSLCFPLLVPRSFLFLLSRVRSCNTSQRRADIRATNKILPIRRGADCLYRFFTRTCGSSSFRRPALLLSNIYIYFNVPQPGVPLSDGRNLLWIYPGEYRDIKDALKVFNPVVFFLCFSCRGDPSRL